MPALPPYIIEPIWEQFVALLPPRKVQVHPLGCHRHRVPERLVFDKLVQVLVFGCAYERIADGSCSATTLRRRRDEWIGSGAMEKLRQMVLEAYDRMIGLELSEVAVDCCITKELLVVVRRREEARGSGEAGHQTLHARRCQRYPAWNHNGTCQSPRLAAVGRDPGHNGGARRATRADERLP